MMPSMARLIGCAALFLAAGCYDYVQVETAPPAGRRVALEISDKGRVALGERFGPGLAEIEGTLLESRGSEYVLEVRRVAQIGGSSADWSGEETHVSRDFVGSVRKRELSKWRTGLLVAGVAGGVIALTARGLAGSLSESDQQSSNPPPVSLRIPLRIPLHLP